ncbi:MAG: hypothetical protein ACTSU2_03755 [Promethearchaeota archaeon]
MKVEKIEFLKSFSPPKTAFSGFYAGYYYRIVVFGHRLDSSI